MERRYRTLRLKVKKYLKSEQRKKSWMGRCLSTKIFDERFWLWHKHSVAVGAGWGAVSSIMPLPMQSLWGVAACVWKKGNIPVAVFMAWLSPPGSIIAVVPLQWWLGWWILTSFGFDGSGASIKMLENAITNISLQPLGNLNYWMLGTEFLLGLALSCTVLGLLCYGLVLGIWSLVEGVKHRGASHDVSDGKN